MTECNITASVHKKAGSPYYRAMLRYRDPETGQYKQVERSTKCVKKGPAIIAMAQMMEEYEEKLANTTWEPDSDMLFVDLLNNWRDAFEDIEESTVEGYENNFTTHILPYFADCKLKVGEVHRKHIQEFINHKGKHGRLDGKGGLNRESVKKYVSNIAKVLDYALYTLEIIRENPAKHVSYPISIFPKKTFTARFLSLDSIQILLDHVLDDVFLKENEYSWCTASGLILALYYALRRGEIYGLRWRDIDFENDILRIENTQVRIVKQTHEKSPKNESSQCAMPLIPDVKAFLLRLKAHQEECRLLYGDRFAENDYVVKQDNGEQAGLDFLNKNLQRILAKENQPVVTLHGLRHSTATFLRSLGYSVPMIQSWLRHGDIKSTMRYAHDNLDLKADTAMQIEASFSALSDFNKRNSNID